MSAALLRSILRHELRLLARSRAAWAVAALVIVIFASAAWNGARWTAGQRRTVDAVIASDARLYRDIDAQLDTLQRLGDPRPDLQLAGMAWYIFQPEGALAPAPHLDPRRAEAASSEWVGARHAVLPPAPLSAIAIGQSDLYPFYTRVTIRTRPMLVQSDEIENPVNLLSGRFDLAFALTFCWPLLVLPLLYNLLSEEREGGTLALVASQPVSVRTIAASRLAVRGGAVVAVTLAASIGALAATAAVDVETSGTGILLWIGAVMVMALFWCGMAAIVNLARWRSATNATVLAAAWLLTVVVLPAVIGELAAVMSPVPSRVELVNAVRQAGSLSAGDLTALVSTYYEAHPDASRTGQSADETAIRGLAQQDAVDRRIDPILDAYQAAVERQQQLVDTARFVSPPLLIYDALGELAGTTARRYRRFAAQVDAFHREWRAYFYPMVHVGATMTRAHYDAAPRFEFSEERPGAADRRAAGLIAVTAAWSAGVLIFALWRVSRSAVFAE
jgi:ABC-2 type transport system permease protein